MKKQRKNKMQIKRSYNGDLAGVRELEIGDVITVDAYKGEDEDLASHMDSRGDGVGQVVESFDDEADLIWVEDCPYAIPAWLCWYDRGSKVMPNGRVVDKKEGNED